MITASNFSTIYNRKKSRFRPALFLNTGKGGAKRSAFADTRWKAEVLPGAGAARRKSPEGLYGRGLWVCPWCGRIAFFMWEKDRKDRYRAGCGSRTDEELSALLESPDAPALLRDAARECWTPAPNGRRRSSAAARRRRSVSRRVRRAVFSPAFSAAGTTISRAKISRPSSEPAP